MDCQRQNIRRADSLKKYSQCNNQNGKQSLNNQFESHRNELSTLMKQCKKQYYSDYFINNIKDVKKF